MPFSPFLCLYSGFPLNLTCSYSLQAHASVGNTALNKTHMLLAYMILKQMYFEYPLYTGPSAK